MNKYNFFLLCRDFEIYGVHMRIEWLDVKDFNIKKLKNIKYWKGEKWC